MAPNGHVFPTQTLSQGPCVSRLWRHAQLLQKLDSRCQLFLPRLSGEGWLELVLSTPWWPRQALPSPSQPNLASLELVGTGLFFLTWSFGQDTFPWNWGSPDGRDLAVSPQAPEGGVLGQRGPQEAGFLSLR